MTKGEKLFQVIDYILVILLCITILFPLMYVISTSLVSREEYFRRGSFILYPQQPTLKAYIDIFSEGSLIINAYYVTIKRVVLGTALNVIFTSALAYGLSKKNLFGRNFFITLIFITMFFGGGLVPTYFLVTSLGMKDTLWALIIPGLISSWNVILMKSYFTSNDTSALEESALIDGANDVVILFKIIIPVSLPLIATIALFCAVGHWNAWFDSAIYISDYKKYPIQMIMNAIVISNNMRIVNNQMGMFDVMDRQRPPNESIQAAIIVVATLPIVFVYPFLQKYFVKGIMIGSIKG